MTEPGVTVVVPVWNRRDLVERLFASLAAQTRPAAELLVVDNGSCDGSAEWAESRGARVIRMGRNAGFAAAMNRGIRESRTEWIAALNDDVELAPDYLARLADAARDPSVWFATGKILSGGEGSRIDGTFDAVCRGGSAWRVGHGRADSPAFSAGRPISCVPWTAALFRAEVFDRVGHLEESFESYLEDVDFGLRCVKHGLRGVYVPEAVARHAGSSTLGRWHPETVRRIARNQLLILARHYPARLLLRYAWPILVAQSAWGPVAFRHGTGLAWVRGKLQGLLQFPAARRGCERIDAAVLSSWLCENERTIRAVQEETGFDSYWRVYFLLTGDGAK